ncbi:hypothetical protein C8R43DRAFT_1109089 [Mycena crocata]|nr:hypothetical protein C8R43DRAFT_1109089 [Mycena crocata]
MTTSTVLRRPRERSFQHLDETEKYWVDHHDWLKESGYLLRPRFRPGWVPSWVNDPRKNAVFCEDSWPPRGYVIDAVCVSDGSNVLLKKIKNDVHPHEVEIGKLFTDLGPSPSNHCIPILRVLQPPDDDNISIIVMPLLRKYDSPRFDTIGEAVEFFRQMFEASSHLGYNSCTTTTLRIGKSLTLSIPAAAKIPFRDGNSNNILMDGQHLYPRGFHPDVAHQHLKPTSYLPTSSRAAHYTRTERPVKYYFIDFGLSRHYDSIENPPMEDIIVGGDKSPPEHAIPDQDTADPFATDIYYIGNVIRTEFLDGNKELFLYPRLGFEFMRPLVNDMVQSELTMRPKIDEVVARFEEIRKRLSSTTLRSRVVGQREFPYVPDRFMGHWYRHILSILSIIMGCPENPFRPHSCMFLQERHPDGNDLNNGVLLRNC